jgi:hypothetical protein
LATKDLVTQNFVLNYANNILEYDDSDIKNLNELREINNMPMFIKPTVLDIPEDIEDSSPDKNSASTNNTIRK